MHSEKCIVGIASLAGLISGATTEIVSRIFTGMVGNYLGWCICLLELVLTQ